MTEKQDHMQVDKGTNAAESTLAQLFADYDASQPYPNEIVDKGGAVGDELY